jgi:apolipoprotein N-acyltransferase
VAESAIRNPQSAITRATPWALAALSGVLLTYSTPPHSLPGLGLIALVPLLLALPRLRATGSFFAGYLAACIYIAANTWWLATLPAEQGDGYIIVVMFVASVLVRGFSIAIAAVVIRWLLMRSGRAWIWLIPLSWLGFEFVHEFDIPGPYPWLSVAYCLSWFVPFLQTADIWGAYGVAASMVLFNLAIASLFTLDESNKPRLRRAGHNRLALPAAAGVLAIFGTIYGVIQEQKYADLEASDGPMVALIQGNVAQEIKVGDETEELRAAFAEQMRMTNEASQQGAEFIVWPESMVFRGATRDGHPLFASETSRRYFKDGRPDPQVIVSNETRDWFITRLRAEVHHITHKPMLVGVITEVPRENQSDDWKDYNFRRHNSAMALNAKGNLAGIYDKMNLVPGGENVPNEGNPLFRWVAVYYAQELQGGASFIEPGREFTRFDFPSKAPRLKGRPWIYTASICYEFAFPRTHAALEYAAEGERRPDFHINISNEAWFGSGSELDQAIVMSRLRCIETRTPMLRCTNTGITCSIDARGHVREYLTVGGADRNVQGVLMVRPHVLTNVPASGTNWHYAPVYAFAWGNAALLALMLIGRLRAFTARRKPAA